MKISNIDKSLEDREAVTKAYVDSIISNLPPVDMKDCKNEITVKFHNENMEEVRKRLTEWSGVKTDEQDETKIPSVSDILINHAKLHRYTNIRDEVDHARHSQDAEVIGWYYKKMTITFAIESQYIKLLKEAIEKNNTRVIFNMYNKEFYPEEAPHISRNIGKPILLAEYILIDKRLEYQNYLVHIDFRVNYLC